MWNDNHVRVQKEHLPMPLVVEDARGNTVLLSLEPAGKKRLGARVGEARKEFGEWFRNRFRK